MLCTFNVHNAVYLTMCNTCCYMAPDEHDLYLNEIKCKMICNPDPISELIFVLGAFFIFSLAHLFPCVTGSSAKGVAFMDLSVFSWDVWYPAAAILFVWSKYSCEVWNLGAAKHPKHPHETYTRVSLYWWDHQIIVKTISVDCWVLHRPARIVSLEGAGKRAICLNIFFM